MKFYSNPADSSKLESVSSIGKENIPKSKKTDDKLSTDLDLSVDDLCQLANSFAEQGMYDKSISLYETACKIFPGNLALKINLGRIRNLKKQTVESPSDFIQETGEDDITQSEIIVDQCQGLGEVLMRSGRPEEAKQIYEISKLSQKGSYLPYYNLGKLFLELKEYPQAISELETARDLNPFEVQVLSLLGEAYMGQEDPLSAIISWIDALLISGEGFKNKKGPFKDKIKQTMSKIPTFTKEQRNQLVKDRKAHLTRLFENMQEEIQKLGINIDSIKLGDFQKTKISHPPPEDPKVSINSHETIPALDAERLKKLKNHLIFRNMDPKDMESILPFTSEISIREGDYVYHQGDPILGFYLIHRGRVEHTKDTPSGAISYTSFSKGSFFGDDSLMTGRERFTSAQATLESDLLFIEKSGLAKLFAKEKKIAIHFLWYFWKSLSFQIRDSNERMKNFFSVSSESALKKVLENKPGIP
ncbi:MAG: cyclic nucleotide-binding domain-containing protein, partial [Bdellovibrionales bacterium]|nr:cyclic nucleotide-binding domain-containing protein [Bdellovibrionales bacterium]